MKNYIKSPITMDEVNTKRKYKRMLDFVIILALVGNIIFFFGGELQKMFTHYSRMSELGYSYGDRLSIDIIFILLFSIVFIMFGCFFSLLISFILRINSSLTSFIENEKCLKLLDFCKKSEKVKEYVSKINREQSRRITVYEFEYFDRVCDEIDIKLNQEKNKKSCFEVYNKI